MNYASGFTNASVRRVALRTLLAQVVLTLTAAPLYASVAPKQGNKTVPRGQHAVLVTTTEGVSLEGTPRIDRLTILIDGKDGKSRTLPLHDILTVQMASPASTTEQTRIQDDITALMGTARGARDAAEADLADLGPAALTPLLASYKDTDMHEPTAHYRMFARLMPGYADSLDRTLDLVRLTNGEALRGRVQLAEFALVAPDGAESRVAGAQIRRLAVRQKQIDKTFTVEALRHCTPIDFLDTGVGLTPVSNVEETAQGVVRLSFNIDGWASDADGLKVPGPGHSSIIEGGFPFGALVGRIGGKGDRWLAGRHFNKSNIGTGRLYLAVNDNDHWQNNIGSFRVRLRVTDAYDLGDPQ